MSFRVEFMCAIFCREAGDGVCPIYYFNATDSTCTFGDIEGDLGLVPHGQGVKAMTYIGAPELTVERSKLKIYANATSLYRSHYPQGPLMQSSWDRKAKAVLT